MWQAGFLEQPAQARAKAGLAPKGSYYPHLFESDLIILPTQGEPWREEDPDQKVESSAVPIIDIDSEPGLSPSKATMTDNTSNTVPKIEEEAAPDSEFKDEILL